MENNLPKPLTREEIIEKLKAMRVDTGEYLPIKFMHLIVKNPGYDPAAFSQEIEDSEEEIDVYQEIKDEAERRGIDMILNWNKLLKEVPKNSQKWRDNHTKKCMVTIAPFEFPAVCIEHIITETVTNDDGEEVSRTETRIRDYYTDAVMKKVDEALEKYGEIYNIA